MQKKYPFKFLDSYTREDSDIFFGRDDEIKALYEMVFQTDLLLIYGASGTGKTSLIQCGLASKFQSHDWLALNIRRGKNLNDSFEKAIKKAGEGLHLQSFEDTTDDLDDLGWLDDDIGEDSSVVAKKLSPLARDLKAVYLKHFKPIYLIFDQFEELYILGSKTEQDTFIKTVQKILLVEQPVKIILSVREEYLGYLYEFEQKVPQLLRKKLRVEPMNLDKVKSVVKAIGELDKSNVQLQKGEEDAIAEGIFAKIRGKEKTLNIQLPYLQVFLDKFYLQITGDEDRKKAATLNMSTLNGMGDIGDVLRNFLDNQVLLTAQNLRQKPEMIWKILSPFVTLDGTKEPMSAEMLSKRLPDVKSALITDSLQAFVKSRILRYTENEQVYEIAHDSLAKQIHAKRSDEEIAILEVQRLINTQSALKAEAREFFTEKQLLFIEPYQKKLNLSKGELKHIDDSRKEVARVKNQERKRKRIILAAVAAAFIIMTGLTFWAVQQKGRAEIEKKNAETAQKSAVEAQLEAENEKDKATKALTDFLEAQAAKERLKFDNLESRAATILEYGGCPTGILEEMKGIISIHPDSILLKDKLQNILAKNPSCR